MPDPVEVQFLPSGKKVKAYLGQNIGMIAKAANVEIKYSCKKGIEIIIIRSIHHQIEKCLMTHLSFFHMHQVNAVLAWLILTEQW